MKFPVITFLFTLSLFMIQGNVLAQKQENPQSSIDKKKYSLKVGLGYFRPFLSDEGVSFPNATYAPEIGIGFSYFTSVDYPLSENFALGLGLNGNFANAEFIKEAMIENTTVDGYLEAGALSNIHILANLTYESQGEGIRPFAKVGLGYAIQQVELGDVPLELTNNIETEIFPDYKSSGFGILPELGVRYEQFYLSAVYNLSFDKLSGEEVPGDFISPGTISSKGFQINVSYRLF